MSFKHESVNYFASAYWCYVLYKNIFNYWYGLEIYIFGGLERWILELYTNNGIKVLQWQTYWLRSKFILDEELLPKRPSPHTPKGVAGHYRYWQCIENYRDIQENCPIHYSIMISLVIWLGYFSLVFLSSCENYLNSFRFIYVLICN